MGENIGRAIKSGDAAPELYIPAISMESRNRMWRGLNVAERPVREMAVPVPTSVIPYEYFAVHNGSVVARAMTAEGLAEQLQSRYGESDVI